MPLKKDIMQMQGEIADACLAAKDEASLEKVRLFYLGRHGKVAECMEHLKALTVDDRRVVGPLLNGLKSSAQELIQNRLQEIVDQQALAATNQRKNFDVTAYRPAQVEGSLHLYTQVAEELEDIFLSMGYELVDGPEVEEEFYNFTALNIPLHHPARDMHDTFWLTLPGRLMRTHTSNVQVRAMKQRTPPFALYSSGRCFRNEALDASHDFMFKQGELLVVGKDISLSHLLATAKAFLRAIFRKADLKIRVRPGYFPFVEPGVEIDASCPFCSSGCSVCKKTGWIEILGAGLVHPNVLMHGGIDPKVYSGFALGFGLARIVMLRHGVNDVRLFESANIEFLKQF